MTDSRACAPKAPPRVCLVGSPDYGHVVELADIELLPGECAAAGDEGRGGLIHVETSDPRHGGRSRWLGTRKGKTTIVEVQADGKPVRVARRSCDQTP